MPTPAAAIQYEEVTLPQDAAEPTTRVVKASNPFVLKRLSNKHKNMVALSRQGMSRDSVAEYCGCTPQYVTMILKQPLARAYIADLEVHLDTRLRGLYEKSVNVIADVLDNGKNADRLAAAQIQLEAIGKRKLDPSEGKQTAEDIVSAMLIQNSNVQVNISKST